MSTGIQGGNGDGPDGTDLIPEEVEQQLLRIRKDLHTMADTLSADAARYLVDLYYIVQDQRIRAAGQTRALQKSGEPNAFVELVARNFHYLEQDIKKIMHLWSLRSEVGRWSRSVTGIGPVLAAGLIANIPLEKTVRPSSLWRFAGYNPNEKWGKGERRPYNARLKVLCYKIGESFIKQQNHPDCFYGKLFRKRRDWEGERNAAQAYTEQAALGAARVKKTTLAYQAYRVGRLPDGHLHARARRWTVKQFLVHWLEVARRSAGLSWDGAWLFRRDNPVGFEHEFVPPPGWTPPDAVTQH